MAAIVPQKAATLRWYGKLFIPRIPDNSVSGRRITVTAVSGNADFLVELLALFG